MADITSFAGPAGSAVIYGSGNQDYSPGTAHSDMHYMDYNRDYQTSYSPSMAPDTSWAAYYRAMGVSDKSNDPIARWIDKGAYESWATSMNNQYQSYLDWYKNAHSEWYNSEAQRLSRQTAIGQNPFYSGALGSEMNPSSAPDLKTSEGQQFGIGEIIQPIMQALSLFSNYAGVVNTLEDSAAARELTRQKALAQGIENRKQLYLLGFDNPQNLGGSLFDFSRSFGLTARTSKQFQNWTGFGDMFGMKDSIFGHQTSAALADLQSKGGYRQFQLDNILPSISMLYNAQAAIEGMTPKEAKEFHDIIGPLYRNAIKGQYEMNTKALMEDILSYVPEKWRDEAKIVLLGISAVGALRGQFQFGGNTVYNSKTIQNTTGTVNKTWIK